MLLTTYMYNFMYTTFLNYKNAPKICANTTKTSNLYLMYVQYCGKMSNKT